MPTEVRLDSQLLNLVVSELREMPGLAVTLPQACRLFGCDEATARRVAEVLVEQGVLRWAKDQRLMCASGEV